MQDLYPFDKSVHDLTIDDLQKLVDDKVKPGYYIEYYPVGNNYTSPERNKIDQIARTIASFANTDGGWCILGIQVKKGGILKINGTSESNIKKYVKALDDFLLKQINLNIKDKIASSRKNLTFCEKEDNKSKDILVIYIPPQTDENLLAFKTDKRIYRRFQESFGEPFPDIGGKPFYHYQTFDELREHEQQNQNAYIESEQECTFLFLEDIWRLREFHQDSEFKPEHLQKIKIQIAPDRVDKIIVYNIDGFPVLVDGFYRVAASIENNFDRINATVKVGTRKEALKESCTNNKTKENRSDPTKARIIETYLKAIDYSNDGKLPQGYTYQQIGDELNIHYKTIGRRIEIDSKTNNINKNNTLVRANTTEEVFNLSDIIQKFAFPENETDRWIRIIERKKQVIIYGPPGTGKTLLAKDLAKHLTKTGDEGKGTRWDIVQFHPSYSYEDFIQGIRPEIVKEKSQDELSTDDQSSTEVNGQIKYKWEDGIFQKFCKKVEEDNLKAEKGKSKEYYVFIIDEINRANLSSVFGELMYLLEYRDEEIKLAGNGKPFGIPENVRIIGTMNTADRSVSPIDNALRRRFAFLHLPPNTKILASHYQGTEFPIKELTKALDYVNEQIKKDDFKLGVSFFLDLKPKDKDKNKNQEDYIKDIEDIWKMEIEPYLKDNSFIINEKLSELTWDEKIGEYFTNQNKND